ncbi:MAG: hypothetical protein FWE42_08010 [Defluviitaleaceae bacterium]|nr:hypothetical protein [Defluviitaleaceae bacterium]
MKEYRVLISAAGTGGSRVNKAKDWTFSGYFFAYRETGGQLVEAEGSVRLENCSEKKMKNLQQKIRPYTVIRVMATLENNFLKTSEILEIATPHEDEAALIAKDKLPVTFTDARFGTFRSCVHRGQCRVGVADLRQSRRLFRRLPRRQARKSRRRVV